MRHGMQVVALPNQGLVMDELVRMLSSRLGLSEEISRQAVELVLSQLKQHFPAPIAGQIDNLMKGTGSLSDLSKVSTGGALGKLGGLFGRK